MRALLRTLAVITLIAAGAAGSVGAPAAKAAVIGSGAPLATANNQRVAFTYFVNAGYTKVQAAGIVGNLMQESTPNVNPRAVQPNGKGRGIAQWSVGGRWDTDPKDNVVWYAKSLSGSPWDLNLQLNFIRYELATFGYGNNELKAAKTIYSATYAFQQRYEICNPQYCNLSQRVKYAAQVYNAYA